jgi:hypothetical protein
MMRLQILLIYHVRNFCCHVVVGSTLLLDYNVIDSACRDGVALELLFCLCFASEPVLTLQENRNLWSA